MRILTNEVKVGLVIVLAVVFLVSLVSAVGNFGRLWGVERVLVRMDSVAGLERYASVTFAGKRIGVVQKIELREEEGRPWAIVTCSLHEPAYIVEDSTARIAQSSLLGELYLELSRGKSGKRIVDAVTKPVTLYGTPVITYDQLFASVDRIGTQVEDILRDLKRITGDQDIHLNVKNTFDQLEEAAYQIQDTASAVREVITDTTPDIRYLLDKGRDVADSLQSASNKMQEGADQLPELITQIQQDAKDLSDRLDSLVTQAQTLAERSEPKLDAALENFSLLAEQVRGDADRLANDLRELAANLNNVVVENRGELSRILGDLAVTASHLASISRQLDEHPWRVIWRTEGRLPPPTITPDWNPVLPEPGGQ